MPIEVRPRDPVKVVRLTGEFTVGRHLAKAVDLQGRPVDDLHETLTSLMDGGSSRIVLDLSLVTFIDSAGLGELVASKKRAMERDGDIKLLAPARRVQELLVMTHLNRVFEIYPTEDEAVGSF